MGSRKRPCDKTIEGGRLRELLAESLAFVVGYQLYGSDNMIVFLLSIVNVQDKGPSSLFLTKM